jgi:hypothetical protein
MIEELQHRVDVTDGKGEVFSLPCDSDRQVVVALVPSDGKLAFSDRLFVSHRQSGGRLILGEARQRSVEIQRSAVLWVSNFWTMVDDGDEVEE